MDGMTLILMLVALGIGLLIGLLINSLRESASVEPFLETSEHSEPLPDIPSPASPPQRGLEQAGIIWRDKKSKLFLEIDGELMSAADLFSGGATRSLEESAPAPRDSASVLPPTPIDIQSPPVREEEQLGGALSIVEQVDDILQELVADSPLSEKDVHLMDDPQKGMIMWVGSNSYESIEEMDDPDLRMLIRGAVAEWEARAGED